MGSHGDGLCSNFTRWYYWFLFGYSLWVLSTPGCELWFPPLLLPCSSCLDPRAAICQCLLLLLLLLEWYFELGNILSQGMNFVSTKDNPRTLDGPHAWGTQSHHSPGVINLELYLSLSMSSYLRVSFLYVGVYFLLRSGQLFEVLMVLILNIILWFSSLFFQGALRV